MSFLHGYVPPSPTDLSTEGRVYSRCLIKAEVFPGLGPACRVLAHLGESTGITKQQSHTGRTWLLTSLSLAQDSSCSPSSPGRAGTLAGNVHVEVSRAGTQHTGMWPMDMAALVGASSYQGPPVETFMIRAVQQGSEGEWAEPTGREALLRSRIFQWNLKVNKSL